MTNTDLKLMLVIVRSENHKQVVNRLIKADFRVTELSSTGGFFRRGNATLIIGLAAERMDEALNIIRTECPTAPEADEHSATIFVMNAQQITEI